MGNRGRSAALVGSTLLTSMLIACVISRDSETSGDSSASVTVLLDTMHAPSIAASTRPPPDSSAPKTVPTLPEIPTTLGAGDTIVATGEVVDSGGAAPTAAQLSALSDELIIPLPGVKPDDLVDTFHELRGGGTRMHEALDIMAPRGTPVLSAAPGRVLKLHLSKAGGLMVYAADSTERFVLMYAHLDSYAPGLRDGLPLQRGQVLGYVGTTGNAPPNAPHLHFAIAHPRDVNLWWTGVPVDPRPVLQHRIRAR